jgi:hypothetical protein
MIRTEDFSPSDGTTKETPIRHGKKAYRTRPETT